MSLGGGVGRAVLEFVNGGDMPEVVNIRCLCLAQKRRTARAVAIPADFFAQRPRPYFRPKTQNFSRFSVTSNL